MCSHVEALCRAKRSGQPVPDATAAWTADLSGKLRRQLEGLDLLEPRERRTCPALGEWLQSYIDGRGDVKESTGTVYGHTKRCLINFFGEGRRLDTITPGDADAFRVHLATSDDETDREALADNTVRRRMGIAKQFFRAAQRKRLIGDNPFDGQATVVRENAKRFYYVTETEAQAVLAACPDAQWKLIFALARYGGLRCPSEVLKLKWVDIDWEHDRFTVHSDKTEHHADGGIRQVPIFPEILPHLRDVFEQAAEGTEYVITRYRDPKQNLRTQLTKIIKRAGVTPWGKLFQNLRSTRETELAETYPVQTVCRWIGNTPKIAMRHYLQTTEEHWTRAAGKAKQGEGENRGQNRGQPVHSTDGQEGTQRQTEEENLDISAVKLGETPTDLYGPNQPVGDTGLEPVTLRV
ncbi:MAG: tyrosine-type recombinase/integrase [Planctomycetaceae bacterium]|nr:tyrosine-type recombinase/integrase [Planctomycetaceae bacterium]